MKLLTCALRARYLFFALLAYFATWATPCLSQDKTTVYTYDALGRLTFVEDSQNGNRDYDYDKAGNRLLVSTDTDSDSSSVPESLTLPTNLSRSHIGDCAWRANWKAVAGASYYIFLESNGTSREINTTQAIVSCPRGKPNSNRPKSVRACNSSMGCGYPAYFNY